MKRYKTEILEQKEISNESVTQLDRFNMRLDTLKRKLMNWKINMKNIQNKSHKYEKIKTHKHRVTQRTM